MPRVCLRRRPGARAGAGAHRLLEELPQLERHEYPGEKALVDAGRDRVAGEDPLPGHLEREAVEVLVRVSVTLAFGVLAGLREPSELLGASGTPG